MTLSEQLKQKSEEWLEKVTMKLDKLMEDVKIMHVEVSENIEEYNLDYVAQKMARCSFVMGRLSVYSGELLEASNAIEEIVYKAKQLTSSEDHKVVDSIYGMHRKRVEDLKKFIGDRMNVVKRIESGLRSQKEILESRVSQGLHEGY